MYKAIIWTSVIALFAALFESTILADIALLPVIPDVVLIITLYCSQKNGSFCGETSGFISGVILDLISSAPAGLNPLVRTVTCFLCGAWTQKLNADRFLLPALLGFCATIFKAVLIKFVSLFFSGLVAAYSFFNSALWIEALLNALIAPIIFFLLNFFPSLTVHTLERQDV